MTLTLQLQGLIEEHGVNAVASTLATLRDLRGLIEAHEAGANWAKNLKVGDKFVGAFPAASEAGFGRGTPAFCMFLNAALDVLDITGPISVDDKSNITEFHGRPIEPRPEIVNASVRKASRSR